ncbi:MAG TPA: hypothetical protein VF233_02555 [Nitrososphaeraceae archaeon]
MYEIVAKYNIIIPGSVINSDQLNYFITVFFLAPLCMLQGLLAFRSVLQRGHVISIGIFPLALKLVLQKGQDKV